MTIDFTGTGQGLSLTGTNFESKVDEFNRKFREATGMNSGSVGSDPTEFAVPVGPGRMVGTDTFVNPDAPYISLYDARREVFPKTANTEIKQKLLEMKATDPKQYKDFLDLMDKSGYDDVDEMLQGAALAKQDVNEFLTSRADMGLFGSGSGGPTTTVTTNESNRGQAFTTVNPQFEAGLGRQVNPDEVADFQKTLNQFERANPYVTTSGRGFSKTTGGFNPAELARSYVQGQEDYAESQVASNFLGVLDGILADPRNRPGPDLQERMSRMGY